MATKEESQRKCFTFIWKLANASFSWPAEGSPIESPPFDVYEIEETKWKLQMFPKRGTKGNYIGLLLLRLYDGKGSEKVEIDFELSFLAPDRTNLESIRRVKEKFARNRFSGSFSFVQSDDIFRKKKSIYLPRDTLSVCCRMWKSEGEISEHAQYIARTHIGIEKMSFEWNVENFSTLRWDRRNSYDVKSRNGKNVLSLDLILNREEEIHFVINRKDRKIKYSMLEIFLVNHTKNDTVKCFKGDFWFRGSTESQKFKIFQTKSMLLEKKSAYLSNDILFLRCKCVLSFGIVREEIERVIPHFNTHQNSELNNPCSDETNVLKVSKKVLNESLKKILDQNDTPFLSRDDLMNSLQSTINNSSFSDVELKTRFKTYPSHKFILANRSPAMFLNKGVNNCINVEDFEDDTVFLLLQYVYSGELEELNWKSAISLYEAAKKYQILTLKDVCLSYIAKQLNRSTVCEALILADLNQEEDLKECVHNFILRHRKDIMNSKQWEHLMEKNPKLAANTMCKIFKS